MKKKLNTFIPAGGLGSRLRPHTDRIPKPLLPMGAPERKVIDGPLDFCINDSDHVWVSTDYLGEQIEEHLSDYAKVTTLRDIRTQGSGGSLVEHYRKMIDTDGDSDVLVLPSDHIYDGSFNLKAYLDIHRESDAPMTLMTVPRKSYGEYARTANGGYLQSVEKDRIQGHVSTTGTYMFKSSFIVDRLYRLERSGLDQLNIYKDIVCPAIGNIAVASYFVDTDQGFWEDTGTPERYLASNMRLSQDQNVIDIKANVEDCTKLHRCVLIGAVAVGQYGAYANSIISDNGSGKMNVTRVL